MIRHKVNIDMLALAGKNVPVYISHEGRICFNIHQGPLEKPVFLLTIPKSGTYLLAEVLKRIGMTYAGCQLSTHDIFDQRFGSLEEHRLRPGKFLIPFDFSSSCGMVLNGQFTMGHIPCTAETIHYTDHFVRVFSCRQMRDVIMSCVKYYSTIMDYRSEDERVVDFKTMPMSAQKVSLWMDLWGVEYRDLSYSMLPWVQELNIPLIRFEDLIGKNGNSFRVSAVTRLADAFGIKLSYEQTMAVLNDVVATKTVTSSGKVSDHKEFWDIECEKKFQALYYQEIDIGLGYS